MVLIKFCNVEKLDIVEGYIGGLYHDNPAVYLQAVKEVDNIYIDGKHWKYSFSEFRPSFDDEFVNTLVIYVGKATYED